MAKINIFMERHGINYSIERNNEILSQQRGLINTEQSTGKRYIGFYPDIDIQTGDFLINPYGDKYYVSNREVQVIQGSPYQLKCYITPCSEYQKEKSTSASFYVENAYGSVIGTQANVVLNYNDSIQQAKELINSSDSQDKQELQQIISLLEMVINNQVPPQKGLFSKFSAVMERNSWITGTIASAILNWLTTLPH